MKRLSQMRGSALIEFAIALAVLTPVFVGGWQFFEAYLLVEDLHQAVIEGAHSAASLPYDSSTETPTPEFRRAVENAVLRPSIPGLRREHLRVTMRFDAGRPNEVEVRVAGYKLGVPGGAITLDGKPKAQYPFRGYWSGSAP